MNPETRSLVRDAYLHALALDSENRPARFNLTVLDLHADPDDRDRLVRTLVELRSQSRRPPGAGLVSDLAWRLRDHVAGVRGSAADPLWWQATYALAAAHAHAGARDKATDVAWEGVRAGLWVIARSPLLRTPTAAFAVDTTPSLAVLYIDVAGVPFNPKVAGLARSRQVRALARRMAKTRRSMDSDSNLLRLVRSLPITPRTRYNLACLYAMNGFEEEADEELRAALPGLDSEMLDWARRDPSLNGIRRDTFTTHRGGVTTHSDENVTPLLDGEVERRARRKRATMPPVAVPTGGASAPQREARTT